MFLLSFAVIVEEEGFLEVVGEARRSVRGLWVEFGGDVLLNFGIHG